MNYTISLSKIFVLVEQIFTGSILSRPLIMKGLGNNYHVVTFDGYHFCSVIFMALFFGVLFFSCIYYFKKAANTSHEYKLLQMLVAVFFLNFILHLIYGSHEAFMYTPHFLFIVFIIYGIVSKSWDSKIINFIHLFFAFFVIYEIGVNIYSYEAMRLFLIRHLSTPQYSMLNVSAGVLYIFFLISALIYKVYKQKESFFVKKMNFFFSVDAAYVMMLSFSSICVLSMVFVYLKVFTEP